MRKGIGSHQSAKMGKDEWLTPPELVQSLGHFDLDPCSPINRPWPTAETHYTIEDDGLKKDWFGRVWCNPPYGTQAKKWLSKLSDHKNGTALVFARLETSMFFDHVWDHIDSYFVIKGRLYFHHVDGSRASSNSGAPSVLLAYDELNSEMIAQSGLEGIHLPVSPDIYIISREDDKRTWRVIVNETIHTLGEESTLEKIYDKVVSISPKRVAKNKHYKAKVRQTLQRYFTKEENKWVA